MGLCDLVPQRHITAARDTQASALAPFVRRDLRDHWGLTRPARPTIHAPLAPIERRDALITPAFPGAATPRELAGVLSLVTTDVGNFLSVSKAIPFPFTLTSLTLLLGAGGGIANERVTFLLIDQDPGASNVFPLGRLIYDTPVRAFGSEDSTIGRGILAAFNNDQVVPIPVPHLIETQPGKHIAMFARITIAISTAFCAIWVVRELMAARNHV